MDLANFGGKLTKFMLKINLKIEFSNKGTFPVNFQQEKKLLQTHLFDFPTIVTDVD